jgi:hypothetical protein
MSPDITRPTRAKWRKRTHRYALLPQEHRNLGKPKPPRTHPPRTRLRLPHFPLAFQRTAAHHRASKVRERTHGSASLLRKPRFFHKRTHRSNPPQPSCTATLSPHPIASSLRAFLRKPVFQNVPKCSRFRSNHFPKPSAASRAPSLSITNHQSPPRPLILSPRHYLVPCPKCPTPPPLPPLVSPSRSSAAGGWGNFTRGFIRRWRA